jgi:hypothetical protein
MVRVIATVMLVTIAAPAAPSAQAPATTGAWRPLFDGKTTAGWRGFKKAQMPEGWAVVDGALTRGGKAGDIVSVEQFDDFELKVEWKIAPGANSGIFYRVVETPDNAPMWQVAPEYQLIDDRGYKTPIKDVQKTAGNYDLQPPARDATKPAGEWNETRIVVRGNHVEYWLNGVSTVSFELFSEEWKGLVAKSKFKDHPGYARARRGHIGIQDHGDWAAFRSIQIRELGWEPLFNGKDLTGWKNYGEEKWTVENGEILGEAVTKAYGYLGTEKSYKDFEMRGKFKAEGTGNSGIFYHASITGTSINGVQVEVDPRPDRHTGGLYETGGRQWIVWPNTAAEQAMKAGDWNEVRFSVRGNHIMTWVNGVLALDYTDPAPKFKEGIIALQLHSGGEGRMRFKDLYVRELK